jgi:hypothetical protein
MPRHLNALTPDVIPTGDEAPFFCLLEDDNLVIAVSVRTEQLLEPVRDASVVDVSIHVRTRVTRPTMGNYDFAEAPPLGPGQAVTLSRRYGLMPDVDVLVKDFTGAIRATFVFVRTAHGWPCCRSDRRDIAGTTPVGHADRSVHWLMFSSADGGRCASVGATLSAREDPGHLHIWGWAKVGHFLCSNSRGRCGHLRMGLLAMTGDSIVPEIRCTYCGATENLSADHVPPKCLFPEDRRQALVTVPACQSCNGGFSRDDEYFRFVVVAPAYDYNEAARRLWDGEIIRSVRRRPPMRAAVLNALRTLEMHTPAGVYVGVRPGFRIDWPRVKRVVERTVLGLLWHHFKTAPATSAETKTHYNPDVTPVMEILTTDLALTGIGGDVFRYRYGQTNDVPGYSMWWLCFYGQTTFLTIIAPPEEQRVVELVGSE